jgi:hypothetical protein
MIIQGSGSVHQRGKHSLFVQRVVVVVGSSCDGVRLPSQHCGLGPVALSPDESECDRVSKRNQLGLTPNLTKREPWRSTRRAKEMREFSLFIIPLGLQEFFYMP